MTKKGFDINDIPLPPLPPKYKENERINNLEKNKIPNKRKLFYIIPIFILLICGSIVVGLVLSKASAILLIFVGICISPFSLFAIIFLIIRIYLDFSKAKEFVIKKVSKNFLIADFFQENRRLKSVVVLLNDDGRSFTYKGGLYMIEEECVWFDMFNYPHSYYLPNIPNPLKFGFQKDIKSFIDNLLSNKVGNARDKEGNIIDISYSSKSLQLFKKDKIFSEFHKSPDTERNIMIALGVVGLCVIAIVIIVLVK